MKTLNHSQAPHRAFTLIEMMVALALLGLLLTIIMVPLKASFDSFHLGKSRSDNQAAAQVTLDDIDRDLRHAVYVFPNSTLDGVTTQGPYQDNITPGGFKAPYLKSANPADIVSPAGLSLCERVTPPATPPTDNNYTVAWSNPARLDMLVADTDANGKLINPIGAGATLVTYYARRLDMTQAYDPMTNPIVMYRAELPYRTLPSTVGRTFMVDNSLQPIVPSATPAPNPTPAPYNALLDDTRLTQAHKDQCSASTPNVNFSTRWLTHNVYGEANLEPLCRDVAPNATTTTGLVPASHTLVLPQGVSLLASQAHRTVTGDANFAAPTVADSYLLPDTSFNLLDTNGDGKIDHVDISLAITNFDATNSATLRKGQPTGQSLRVSRSIDLPNIGAVNLLNIH